MEGPGVKVISERLKFLEGCKITDVFGNTKKIDINDLMNKRILEIKSHGKNLLIKIENIGYLRIHFLMYGSYSINEKKREDKYIRLGFKACNNTIYFYNCSVSIWKDVKVYGQDILDEKYDINKTYEILKDYDGYICDALLDQNIFPGVGNIIKVEALFRSKIHPLSIVRNIPKEKLIELIKEVRNFSIIFYNVRKNNGILKKYLLCYNKKKCYYCGNKLVRKRTGNKNRISYYCEKCQILY